MRGFKEFKTSQEVLVGIRVLKGRSLRGPRGFYKGFHNFKDISIGISWLQGVLRSISRVFCTFSSASVEVYERISRASMRFNTFREVSMSFKKLGGLEKCSGSLKSFWKRFKAFKVIRDIRDFFF